MATGRQYHLPGGQFKRRERSVCEAVTQGLGYVPEAVFFFLSKLLDVALDPLWWALVAIAVGLALHRRRPRASLASVVLALLVLISASLPVVSDQLWASLETDAPNSYRPEVTYDAVVLLGGVVDTSGSTRTEVAYGNNVERLTVVFDLLRAGKAKVVLLSGGPLGDGLPTEAAFLKAQLISWGIVEERIVLDPLSKNTRENAVQSAKLSHEHQFASVLLVTSAFHMKRAAGCFKAAGLSVDTLPVDYRMRDPGRDPTVLPRAEYLAESTRAIRELVGRVVYRVLGYSTGP